MSKPTILCVDDERNVLLTLRTQLSRHFPDYSIEIAESGSEALELVAELLAEGIELPLVIADQIMPDMKGDELLIELHRRQPQMLKVMLTGQARAEDVGNVVNQGELYRFLSKPWSETDLRLTVSEALRRYQHDRKQAEAALQESESYHRVLLEQLAIGLLICRMDGSFVYANPAFAKIIGYAAAEVLTLSYWDVTPTDYADQEALQLELLRTAGGYGPYEKEYLHRDGHRVWVRLSGALIERHGESLIWSSVEDISDRKQAEIALQASERRYAALTEMSPSGIFRTDLQGNCLYVNPRWCQIAGLTPEEAAGQGWGRALHPDDRELVFQGWYQAAQNREMPFTAEYRFQRPDGTVTWLVAQAAEETDLQGNVTGYVGSLMDINDRKRAELELLENQTFIQRIADTSAGTIYLYDVQAQRNLYTNRDLLNLLGYSTEEMQRMESAWLTELIHPEDLESVFQHQARILAAQDRETLTLEYRIRRRDGQWFWAQSFDTPFKRDMTGQICQYLGTVFDVTERKQSENALRESEERNRAILSAIPDMMTVISADCQYLSFASNQFAGEQITPKAENIVGMSVSELLPPQPARDCLAAIQRALSTREMQIYEQQIQFGDRIQHEEVRIVPYQADRVLCMVRDITERNRAEAALRESENRFRELAETVQEGFFIGDAASFGYAYANPAYAAITGFTIEEIYADGSHWLNRIHAEDRQQVEAALSQEMQGEMFDQEYRFVRPDGITIWMRSQAFPVLDDTGAFVRRVGVIEDITARKQAEIALQQLNAELEQRVQQRTQALLDSQTELQAKEQFLRGIFEGTENPIFVVDRLADSRFQYSGWNKASEIISGVSSADILGKHPEEIFGEEIGNAMCHNYRRCCESGGVIRFEEYLALEAGDTWTITTLSPLKNSAGEIYRIIGSALNITDRKQAEVALAESEARFRQLAENIDSVFWLTALHFQILYVSPAFERIWGRPAEDVFNSYDTFIHTIHPEDRERAGREMAQRLQGDAETEYRIIRPDGEIRWIRDRAFPIRNADGEIYRIAGIAEDITERRRTAEALQQSEQRFRKLFEAMPNPIRGYDQNYRMIFWNSASEALYGYSAKETIGKRFGKRLRPSSLRSTAAPEGLAVESPLFNGELELIGKDGTAVPVYSSYVQLTNMDGQQEIYSVDIDLRERKQMEQELRQINADLERRVDSRTFDLQQAMEAAQAANRAKSTFLSNMSHELRTPLNAILGFSQLLNRSNSLDLEQQEQVGIINRSGEHLLNLINDILAISKIEAGRITLTVESFDLHCLLKNLEDMFRLQSAAKGLTLTAEVDPAVPQYIQTDDSKLRQVLINLLGNAIKFTDHGGIILRVQIAQPERGVAPDSQPLLLRFAVKDTGIGINLAEHATIFEPFGQTQAGQKAQSGTGLGLPISRQFVQLMGGELSLTSTPGQGATFAFTIPVATIQASDLPAPLPSQRVIGLAADQPSYRLLVVEDNPENRRFLAQLLRLVGFEVQVAENGQEAVDLWQSWHPDLIWMDIQMPVLDGYQATRQIRSLEQQVTSCQPSALASPAPKTLASKATKILALTASAFEDERAAILAAGCDDFILKPAIEGLLFEKITEHLDVHYLYQALAEADAAGAATYSLSAAALHVMPLDWIAQMHRAACIADDSLMLELLDQIPADQIELAQALRSLILDFELDRLIELTA